MMVWQVAGSGGAGQGPGPPPARCTSHTRGATFGASADSSRGWRWPGSRRGQTLESRIESGAVARNLGNRDHHQHSQSYLGLHMRATCD